MKALSIRQPWVRAIQRLGKGVENRSRYDGKMPSICAHRGPLLLHASAGCTRAEYTEAVVWMHRKGLITDMGQVPPLAELDRGCIVGMVDAVGHILPSGEPCGRIGYPVDKRWHVPGSYGLIFSKAGVQPLPMAVPWKGALGLFDVRAEDVLAVPASVSPHEATAALAAIIRQHGG